jgi:small subunit ribosomal protein S14
VPLKWRRTKAVDRQPTGEGGTFGREASSLIANKRYDMAKKSAVEKNNRRKKMAASAGPKRERLKAIVDDRTKPLEERFAATLKLAKMPRNSSPTRIRNRCEMTGRPRSVYQMTGLSRITLRELGSRGLIPGLVKSSW